MKNRNAARGAIVLAILLVVFSVIAFAVPFAKTPVFWLAYGFGVFAILFQLYIFRISDVGSGDARSRFYGFPIARIGIYYLVAQLIVSLVEMALAAVMPAWLPVMLNVLLAALAILGCITVETMRSEIVQQDIKLKKNVSRMRELQSLSATLVGQCSDEGLKPVLQKLADDFRYSDPVSSNETAELEDDMREQLRNIQQSLAEGDTDSADKLCSKLSSTLAERNRLCSVNKQK